ncbi:MAG TPA: BON domain-containing protein [Blastocatellia bacterium]|nr:BON domain-containing protein [Blastocatellia bacterium]
MATNQNLSNTEKGGSTPVQTLDESLAQLEEALDLFVTSHSDGQIGEAQVMEEKPVIHPLQGPPVIKGAESVPTVAAPVQSESMEQAIRELKQKIAAPQTDGAPLWPAAEVVVRAPEDDQTLTKRRFPLFTDGQKKLMLLVVVVLAFFALIGYLVWQRQKSDELRLALEKQEDARFRSLKPESAPVPSDATTTTEPVSTAVPAGDQGLAENIRQILIAYNPSAANTRYKVEAKDGVVTLSGEVQTQMEKEGVENVIKPLTGIVKINNNLVVKGLMSGPSSPMQANGPVMYPQVNSAEARRLEEALKRDLAEGAKRAEDERLRIEQRNAELIAQRTNEEATRQEAAKQEADRLRRQQSAQVHNDEDAAFRKQAEERLKQREKEEAERRAEEHRKPEVAQPQKTEAPRAEASVLRSGTVAWRGIVKGVEDIVIRGTSASIQHVSGDAAKDAKGVFSAAVPNAPISMRLVAASGPSPIRIIQQPSASNNFTTIVRVGDGGKADGKPHTFTLRWSTQ